jgi:hypothetical protein
MGVSFISKTIDGTKAAVTTILGKKGFLVEGKPSVLDVYSSMEVAQTLRVSGLNSGTLIAIPHEKNLGVNSPKFTIHKVYASRVEAVAKGALFSPFGLKA